MSPNVGWCRQRRYFSIARACVVKIWTTLHHPTRMTVRDGQSGSNRTLLAVPTPLRHSWRLKKGRVLVTSEKGARSSSPNLFRLRLEVRARRLSTRACLCMASSAISAQSARLAAIVVSLAVGAGTPSEAAACWRRRPRLLRSRLYVVPIGYLSALHVGCIAAGQSAVSLHTERRLREHTQALGSNYLRDESAPSRHDRRTRGRFAGDGRLLPRR